MVRLQSAAIIPWYITTLCSFEGLAIKPIWQAYIYIPLAPIQLIDASTVLIKKPILQDPARLFFIFPVDI